jgi:hypothetical protein
LAVIAKALAAARLPVPEMPLRINAWGVFPEERNAESVEAA